MHSASAGFRSVARNFAAEPRCRIIEISAALVVPLTGTSPDAAPDSAYARINEHGIDEQGPTVSFPGLKR